MSQTQQLEKATQEAVLIAHELQGPGDGATIGGAAQDVLLQAHLKAARKILTAPVGVAAFDPKACWVG